MWARMKRLFLIARIIGAAKSHPARVRVFRLVADTADVAVALNFLTDSGASRGITVFLSTSPLQPGFAAAMRESGHYVYAVKTEADVSQALDRALARAWSHG